MPRVGVLGAYTGTIALSKALRAAGIARSQRAMHDRRRGALQRGFGSVSRAIAGAVLVALASACATLPNVASELGQVAADRSTDPARQIERLRWWGQHIAEWPFVDGNDVHLARNGAQVMPALQAQILSAHDRIDMESYEFKGNERAQFSALLTQQRRSGIAVHLIYDGWGSLDAGGVVTSLRDAGATVLEYNPLGPNSRVAIDINRRDHRKLLVVDNKVAVTGGVNITEVYRNLHVPGVTDLDHIEWHDTDANGCGTGQPRWCRACCRFQIPRRMTMLDSTAPLPSVTSKSLTKTNPSAV